MPHNNSQILLPHQYHVMIVYDEYSPMDFLIALLQHFFNKTGDESIAIIRELRSIGKSIIITCTREIAETKILAVQTAALKNGIAICIDMEVADEN